VSATTSLDVSALADKPTVKRPSKAPAKKKAWDDDEDDAPISAPQKPVTAPVVSKPAPVTT
jgi:hypothetical protein